MLDRAKWLPQGAALAAILLAAGCRGEGGSEKAEQNKTATAAVPVELPSIRNDSLDREALILAALRAASAAALGRDDRDAQRELEGRKFQVRIRFGCPGESDSDRSWSYDEQRQVLRVKVKSNLTEGALPASDLLRRAYQGAVGFTLDRPWLLTSGCPAPGSGFTAASGGGATLVVAQLFTDTDSRVQRPERAYQLTKTITPEERPEAGLDLVISGRLAELADGRPIHCGARDGAPVCLVAAKIDRVAIENPVADALLGEWGSGVAGR